MKSSKRKIKRILLITSGFIFTVGAIQFFCYGNKSEASSKGICKVSYSAKGANIITDVDVCNALEGKVEITNEARITFYNGSFQESYATRKSSLNSRNSYHSYSGDFRFAFQASSYDNDLGKNSSPRCAESHLKLTYNKKSNSSHFCDNTSYSKTTTKNDKVIFVY